MWALHMCYGCSVSIHSSTSKEGAGFHVWGALGWGASDHPLSRGLVPDWGPLGLVLGSGSPACDSAERKGENILPGRHDLTLPLVSNSGKEPQVILRWI